MGANFFSFLKQDDVFSTMKSLKQKNGQIIDGKSTLQRNKADLYFQTTLSILTFNFQIIPFFYKFRTNELKSPEEEK